MTRMTGLNCAVIFNTINTHTHTAIGEQEQHPNMTIAPLSAQSQIPEKENLFEVSTVKAVIKKASRKPTYRARQVRLDYATATSAGCAMP